MRGHSTITLLVGVAMADGVAINDPLSLSLHLLMIWYLRRMSSGDYCWNCSMLCSKFFSQADSSDVRNSPNYPLPVNPQHVSHLLLPTRLYRGSEGLSGILDAVFSDTGA